MCQAGLHPANRYCYIAICIWAEYYILSFGTTVKIPFLLPTCLFTQKSSTRWLWTSRRVEDYGDAMFIRPVSEVLFSNLRLCLKCPLMLKVPTLDLFVHIDFMGIREESVQLGKLWARSRVTTTNHHSEPGLFFNRGLSGFLSVSKWSWHLHDRLSSALKGSTLQSTACRGQICSVPTSSSSIYRGQTF